MKLVIHDLAKGAFDFGADSVVICKTKPIAQCVGCFGCWVKTPGRCVFEDGYSDTGRLLSKCDELLIISRCCYGGFSPFVKNVLDRSIGYIHPYFTKRGGEMHHKRRYPNTIRFTVRFYGDSITQAEMDTASRLADANALNFAGSVERVSFSAQPDFDGTATQVSATELAPASANVLEPNEPRRIALVAASPKPDGKSASAMIIKDLSSFLPDEQIINLTLNRPTVSDEDAAAIMDCDALAIAFPLYVDGVPSHLLACMERLAEYAAANPRRLTTVYAICNSGFFEGRQNAIALQIVRNWCERVGLTYGGGVGVGGGGSYGYLTSVTPGVGPKKGSGAALQAVAQASLTGEQVDDCCFDPGMPSILYQFGAQSGWRQMARANGLKTRDLFKRL